MWPLILLSGLYCLLPQSGPQVQTDSPLALRESLEVGTTLEVSSSVSVKGTITKSKDSGNQATTAAISASGVTQYRERVLDAAGPHGVAATVRRYVRAGLDKQTIDGPQRIVLRSAAERIVVRRANRQSTIFSPDGPLTAPEHDMLKADPAEFTPALVGLLPAKSVKPGETWEASAEAAAELTGVEPIQSGALRCVIRESRASGKVRTAKVSLAGSLSGPTELGPTRMTVEGYFLFDLDRHLITYLVLTGRSDIVGDDEKVVGQLEGRYELTRRPAGDDSRIANTALASLDLKPGRQTTALLFEHSKLGVRFVYPRNWELGSVKDNLVQLEDPTGGGMRVTIDAKPAPTADKLRAQLVTWLESRKATVKDAGAAQPVALSKSVKAERFTVQAVLDEKTKEWDYVLVRQGDRSATIAAGLIADRATVLRDDADFVARRLEFLPKQPGK
jgi:hypothetical protein